MPVRHPVEPVPPDLLGTDLVAVPDQQRHVRGHALALAGNAPRSQLPADVVGRKRMLRVRLLLQNLPQRKHLHLQGTVVRHPCSLLYVPRRGCFCVLQARRRLLPLYYLSYHNQAHLSIPESSKVKDVSMVLRIITVEFSGRYCIIKMVYCTITHTIKHSARNEPTHLKLI